MPFKATFPPEEAEDIVSRSHSTKLKTKLNEKPAISDAKVLDAFWECNHLPSLLGPFIPLWGSPKLALIVEKKIELCSRGKKLFKLLLISIKERSFDL